MEEKYSAEIIERAKKVKLLVLDVDGVLTDGRIIYGNYGDELKNFDVNDGLGIFMVRKSGIKCIVVTAKASKVVTKRAKELRIDRVYGNFHYKIKALKKICKKFRVKEEEICFIGDDVIDIPVLKRVWLAVCPPNAMEEVKPFVHLTTEKGGGHGAVREICNFLLKAQGNWDAITSKYFE